MKRPIASNATRGTPYFTTLLSDQLPSPSVEPNKDVLSQLSISEEAAGDASGLEIALAAGLGLGADGLSVLYCDTNSINRC